MRAQSFFKMPPTITIKDTALPNTSGYDIHYALTVDEETEGALKLQDLVEKYIKDYQDNHPDESVHLTKGKITDKPVGPWPTRMWELQISTAGKDTQPYDTDVVEPWKTKAIHRLMLSIGNYAKEQIAQLQLKGSLIIHANSWPNDCDMVLERSMHFETSWHVCGPKVLFKDIWATLIAMEEYLNDQIMQVGKNWYNDEASLAQIKLNFQEKFKHNQAYPYENGALDRATNFLIEGQHNLQMMQASIKEMQSVNNNYI